MKTNIHKQTNGEKPVVYKEFATKKEAKETLIAIFENSIESDDIETISGKFSMQYNLLTLPCGTKYFIERNF